MSTQNTTEWNMIRQRIIELALNRVAQIFGIDGSDLKSQHIFGTDLDASFVSDFKDNELDQIYHDIRDVADKTTLKEMESGRLVIYTVGDYCDHLVKCYETNRPEVCHLLGIEDK